MLGSYYWVAVSAMAFHRALIFLFLILLDRNVSLAEEAENVLNPSHKNNFLPGLQANVTTNISLWAPYYRHVPAGGAWMIPIGVHDLEPRAGECQCLNPDGMNSHHSLGAHQRTFRAVTDGRDRNLLFVTIEL